MPRYVRGDSRPISHLVREARVWAPRFSCPACQRGLSSEDAAEAREYAMTDREIRTYLCGCPAYDVDGRPLDRAEEL